MPNQVYIFPGRYQPFHNDHLSVLKEIISQELTPVFIGIITNPPDSTPATTDFEKEALLQNSPERNPFTVLQRYEMISKCINTKISEEKRPNVIFLPRPETHWTLVKTMFSAKRIWIIPDSGEDFDNMKAKFFIANGDQVHRIHMPPTTDGRIIREQFKENKGNWKNSVPETIAFHIDKILKRRV